MRKKLIKSDNKNELGTTSPSSELGSTLETESRNLFTKKWRRLLSALDAPTDASLASELGITQQSVAGAKRKKRIPPGWITAIALDRGVSADWLLTGEGSMKRGGCVEQESCAGPIYNDRAPVEAKPKPGLENQDFNTAEIISKTIEILESETVFTTAIVSNIEAFHEAIQMKHEMQKFKAEMQTESAKMFQEMRKEIQSVRNENQQLREEIQRDRDQEVTEDTG